MGKTEKEFIGMARALLTSLDELRARPFPAEIAVTLVEAACEHIRGCLRSLSRPIPHAKTVKSKFSKAETQVQTIPVRGPLLRAELQIASVRCRNLANICRFAWRKQSPLLPPICFKQRNEILLKLSLIEKLLRFKPTAVELPTPRRNVAKLKRAKKRILLPQVGYGRSHVEALSNRVWRPRANLGPAQGQTRKPGSHRY